MRQNKFNGIESQMTASILYYDKEELDNFFKIYDQLCKNNFQIDGMFDLFVKYIRNDNIYKIFCREYKDTNRKKDLIVKNILVYNNQNPDKSLRDTFQLWMENVEEIIFNNQNGETFNFELSDDILDHFIWENFKNSIDLVDKSNVPFKEKLLIKPKSIDLNMNEEIVKLNTIKPKKKDKKSYYTTGIKELDQIVQYNKTAFIVIAARTAVGKTLFMIQNAVALARNGKKVLFLSLEVNEEQLDSRILNVYLGENLENRYKNEYGELDFEAYEKAYEEAKNQKGYKPIEENLDLYVPTYSSADSILNKVEKLIKECNYEVVFIDYLQLLRYNRLDEWSSLRLLTKELKSLAFRLKATLITASQVSRSSTETGLNLGDLFGSSTIEADADIVIGLENPRERRQGEKASIIIKVLKQRDGDVAEIKSIVDYSTGRITSQ